MKNEEKVTENRITPNDGFVDKKIVDGDDLGDNYGEKFYGYSYRKTYVTSNPKIIKPFIYSSLTLFFLIGIICVNCVIITNNLVLLLIGVSFIVFSVIGFKIFKRDIDNIEKNLNHNSSETKFSFDNDSGKYYKEFASKVYNDAKSDFKSTFNLEKFNDFKYIFIISYISIVSLTFLFLFFFVDKIISILILILCIIIGISYFKFLKWICCLDIKKNQSK